MFLVLGFEVPAEWGLVGFVTAAAVGGVLWAMRWMAKALERAESQVDEAERRKDEKDDQFVVYLKETASAQVQALTAVGNVLARQAESQQRHDDRALARHEAIMGTLEKMNMALTTVCRNGRTP